MKRTLAFILCMVMLVSMAAIGVSAAVSYADKEPTDVGTLVVKKGASKKDVTESNGSVVNLSDTGTSFCPKKDCWVRYEFNAEKAGTYTFVVEYVARTGTKRGFDYAIDTTDAGKRVLLELDLCADNSQKKFAVITEELTAGTHSFYFFCPTGFDDSTLKSCDIYGWSAYFTKAAAAPAKPADTTGAAPATADTTVVAVAAFAVSACAAIVVAKKRCH